MSSKKKPVGKREQTYQAPALSKGLGVLEYLSGADEPHAVSELARALGKSRNEIYRMVIVLERAEYLVRTDSDRFMLSRKLFDLAMRAPPQRNLLAKALPEMQRLSLEALQSCHLTVPSGTEMVVVARVESPDVVGFSVRVGYRRPLNESASGQVLYAWQSESNREAWRRSTPTKEDRERWDAFERQAQGIRDMGLFMSPSTYVDAVTDIAAPVTMGPTRLAVAALIMPFIGGRSAKISLTQAARATKEAAERISRALA